MASQVIALGESPFSESIWSGAVLLDAALVAGGGTAYLRYIQRVGTNARIRLAEDADADPITAGPELTAALEGFGAALTFAEAGGSSITLKGPAHADNTHPDADEPYFWTPDNGAAWAAWVDGLGTGAVTLTLDDGAAAGQPLAVTGRAVSGAPDARGALSATEVELLALDDFDAEGLAVETLALIEAGAPPRIYGIAPRAVSGQLHGGALALASGTELVTWLRFRDGGSDAGGERISLNDDGPLVQSEYWAAGGAGRDLTLHVQTSADHVSFPVANQLGGSGANYVILNVPAADQAVVAGIGTGDRFLFALTRQLVLAPSALAGRGVSAAPDARAALAAIDLVAAALAGRAVAAAPDARGGVVLENVPAQPSALAGRGVSAVPDARAALAIVVPVPLEVAGRGVSAAPDARAALAIVVPVPLEVAGRGVSAAPDARAALAQADLLVALAARAGGAAHAAGGLRVGLGVQFGAPASAPLPEVSPLAVLAHAGDRLLSGADSAAQRLRDGLLIARGTYPAARDYGSTLAVVLDRSLDSAGQAALAAAVADAIAHPANGLSDVRLRSVRVATGEAVATIDIEADWISQDGTLTPIGLREQLAAG